MRVVSTHNKLTALLVCIIAIITVAACSITTPKVPPPSTRNVVLYPGVQTTIIPSSCCQKATYQVKARPQDVFSFYTSTMLLDGWESGATDVPDAIELHWTYGEPGHEIYSMLIQATQKNVGTPTEVKVNLAIMGAK
jgi:hypothetical protein